MENKTYKIYKIYPIPAFSNFIQRSCNTLRNYKMNCKFHVIYNLFTHPTGDPIDTASVLCVSECTSEIILSIIRKKKTVTY